MLILLAALMLQQHVPAQQGVVDVELLPVLVDNRYGYIDYTGRIVIPPTFEFADEFSGGLAYVVRRDEGQRSYGFIDQSGGYKITLNSAYAESFSEGVAAVKDGKTMKWGFVDRTGRYTIEPRFDRAESFSEGAAVVAVGERFGFIDLRGDYLVEPSFDDARGFSDGLGSVKQSELWGWVGRDGHVAIEPKYARPSDFSEGLAAVKKGKKFGFINHMGDWVIEPIYDEVGSFSEGKAFVQIWGGSTDLATRHRQGLIDKAGEIVWHPETPWIDAFSEGLAAARGGSGKDGYVDSNGEFVIPPTWDRAGRFWNGIARVQIGFDPTSGTRVAKVGYITREGEYIWRPTK